MGSFGVLPGWRGRLPLVLMAVVAMVSPLTTVLPAQAAVKPPLSLSAPAVVEINIPFTVSGYGYPAKVGRVVVVQRRSGTKWIEVGRRTQASTGRYAVPAKLSGVGKFTFRSVALAWRGARVVVSPSRVVSARAPYILLAPSTAIAAESVKVTGKLPGVYSRPVWVQRKSGTRWITLVKAKTSRTGSYLTRVRAPKTGSYALRALAPRVTIARKVRPQYVTGAKTLKVVAQTASLTMPAALVQGQAGTATLTFRPVRTNRVVALQVLKSGVWTTMATGKQSSAGTKSFSVTAGVPATYSYRAWTAALAGAPAFASAARALKVSFAIPGPVTAVTATPASGSVVLSWTNPTSASLTKVMIRRSVGATPPASATLGTLVTDIAKPTTSFTDTGLTPLTQYSYALFAHNVTPAYAAGAMRVTTTTAVPGPVTSVSASPSSGSVALSWASPARATGVMIRRLPGASAPTSIDLGTLVSDVAMPATSFTDRTGLDPLTQYSYAFFAHDATPGYSDVETITRTTTPIPEAVTAITPTPAGRSITLSWTNPTDVTNLTGVVIRRALGANPPVSVTDGLPVADVPGLATTFTDNGRRPLTTYSYALFAHDATPGYAAGTTVTSTTTANPGGATYTWGSNSAGQLGNGTTGSNRLAPVQAGTDTDWTSIAAGLSHTVAIKADGTLWAWGDNTYGQLGDDTLVSRTGPVQLGDLTTWKQVSAGNSHTVAVKADGSMWAWGYNEQGELGDGTVIDKKLPTRVGDDLDWASVTAGEFHTVAVKIDGTLWAWGNNVNGQLGDADPADRLWPGQVGAESDWDSASAGHFHTVAVKTDGTLWAWGYNFSGQLGDGSTTDRTVPQRIGSADTWASVSAGSFHTTAVKTDGTLWSWGSNGFGQLGDGTTINRTAPQRVGLSNIWDSVEAGSYHTVAVRTDGTLWSWGYNGYGQLGDGTTINRTAPQRVGTVATWDCVSAGGNHTVALRP